MSLQTSPSSHRFCFLRIMMWGIGRQRTVNRFGNRLPQDNQESLVVRVKVGRPPGQLGMCKGCASGCVVECRICSREVAGLNLGRGYFAPRSTQPSIPPGSVNEYQLWLGRQRQVWLIPIADERVGVQVKLRSLENTCHT